MPYPNNPLLSSLPSQGYQDNPTVSFITQWYDKKLVEVANTLETFWQNLIPATCPVGYLDYLAYLCGLSGQYWDTGWTVSVKRVLIEKAHTFWASKGTIGCIKAVLDIHQIPYKIWNRGSLQVPFTLPGIFGVDDLTLYIQLPLAYQRSSPQWKETQRTLYNYGAAVIKSQVVFDAFYVGFSVIGEPIF